MKDYLIGAAVAVSAISPAHAASTPKIMFTEGNYALPGYTTATVFQDFMTQPANTRFVPGAREAAVGDVYVRQNSIVNVTQDTDTSAMNQYLSIENGSYSVSFLTPVQFFSFVLGSLDSYNSLRLTFADGSSALYNGRQVIGDSMAGPFNSSVAGRVSYDLGGQSGITAATFSSNRTAFEIDSLAAAVPEPAGWAMMMLGLGAVGYTLRRRQKVTARIRFA